MGTWCANNKAGTLALALRCLSLRHFTALLRAETKKGTVEGSLLLPESILLFSLGIRYVHVTKFSSMPFEYVQLPAPLLSPSSCYPEFQTCQQTDLGHRDKDCAVVTLSFFIFLMILKNFKALIYQVCLLYCIKAGKWTPTAFTGDYLQRQNQL